MLKRSLMIAASSVALAAAVATPSLAAPADFVGTWVNKDINNSKFKIQNSKLKTFSVGDLNPH